MHLKFNFGPRLMVWGLIIGGLSFLKAQEPTLQGSVVDVYTNAPIVHATIRLEKTKLQTFTDTTGVFLLTKNLPLGKQLLIISKEGYDTARLPISIVPGALLALTQIPLHVDFDHAGHNLHTISLDPEMLDQDIEVNTNAAGLLHASKDVFLKTAAFNWSSTFFRPRGYDSNQSKVMINGLEMNKIYNGRPLWSSWGGLNDVFRNQEFFENNSPYQGGFGGLGGTTAITLRASQYRKGAKLSYGLSNRSYTGRVMGSYHSGMMPNGWAYSISLSRRYGTQGYVAGTSYDANAVFAAIEKRLGSRHHINLVAFYTPNHRGKSSPNTQEVVALKGTRYNAYWGYQNGKIRNSRIRRIEEPVVMLNHYWKLNDRMQLQTNFGVQTGQIGNSRIHYGGTELQTDEWQQNAYVGNGSNPDPSYYQQLPSYFLRTASAPDYKNAFLAAQDFQRYGQLDWEALYLANKDRIATYVHYEDRTDDTQIMAGSNFSADFTTHFSGQAAVNYRVLTSENFAVITDLLGGSGFLDIDSFSEGNQAQNDLQRPNRMVGLDEKFQYHYALNASIGQIFAQTKLHYNTWDFFISGTAAQTTYERIGFYENGNAPGNQSLGNSKPLHFSTFGVKSGVTLKGNGNHALQINGAYLTEAPNLRNVFSNPRQDHTMVINAKPQTTQNMTASYTFRRMGMQAKLTGYYTHIKDASAVSFFYTDGISGLGSENSSAFVQEVLTGVSKKHLGLEFGVKIPLHATFTLQGAAAIGKHTYANNPLLYLTSNDFANSLQLGTSALKNYHLVGGPQQAYSLGFSYHDPNYWWLSGNVNYFSNAYSNSSPITRTQNFYTDTDGLPFSDYDPQIAKGLLRQERFDPYFLVNIIGGKSWRIKNYYLGCFLGVNNVLNTRYKTGGFEQSRNSNYKALLAESQRQTPVFGSKYWYGLGTTYFSSLYLRF